MSFYCSLRLCLGIGYLLCWPRGREIGLVCTRRFSFHQFCNFLLFNFLSLIFFFEDFFFYPQQLPTSTPTTHDPRPTTHDPRRLATLLFCMWSFRSASTFLLYFLKSLADPFFNYRECFAQIPENKFRTFSRLFSKTIISFSRLKVIK